MHHGAAFKVPRWLLSAFQGGLAVALIVPSVSFAGVAVCQPPNDVSRAVVGYYDYDESGLSDTAGEVRRNNHDIDLHYKHGETWSFGAGHRYVILDMDPIELQTNGHLHTVFFPIHREHRSDGKNFRFSLAPALSASSNVMKDPGEYSADTFQLLAALLWTREISDQVDFRYGVCGDHRFGEYEIYPAVSAAWRPHPAVLFELGFPVTRLSFEATPSVTVSLGIAPDGNEWHVKSKDLEKQSELVHESTLVEWMLSWRPVNDLVLTVAVGRAFDNRYEVTLLDDRRVDLAADTVTRVGAMLEWRF